MKRSINLKPLIVIILLLVVSFLIGFCIYLNSLFSVEKPKDERFIYLFEEFTKTKFPESGKVINSIYDYGINDGVEAAIIEIEDSIEYKILKHNIYENKLLKKYIQEPGTGYFGSGIINQEMVIDTIIQNENEYFVLAFTKDDNKIVFEKTW